MNNESWSSEAVDDLLALPRTDLRTAGRIQKAVLQFARDETGDVKKLAGSSGDWRLRVGDWRVRFRYRADGTMLIERVLNRRDAYD